MHLRLVLHSVSLSQVSKQAVGSGEGEGEGEGEGLGLTDGDGLGDGEAVTVKLSSQTFSVVIGCTSGIWGDAAGFGATLGVGWVAGLFSCKNKTIAVTSRITVNPINPHNSHFFSPGFLVGGVIG